MLSLDNNTASWLTLLEEVFSRAMGNYFVSVLVPKSQQDRELHMPASVRFGPTFLA